MAKRVAAKPSTQDRSPDGEAYVSTKRLRATLDISWPWHEGVVCVWVVRCRDNKDNVIMAWPFFAIQFCPCSRLRM